MINLGIIYFSYLNGAQFLDIAPLFLLSSCFTIPSAPAPEMVVFHSQVWMHHYNHIN